MKLDLTEPTRRAFHQGAIKPIIKPINDTSAAEGVGFGFARPIGALNIEDDLPASEEVRKESAFDSTSRFRCLKIGYQN